MSAKLTMLVCALYDITSYLMSERISCQAFGIFPYLSPPHYFFQEDFV